VTLDVDIRLLLTTVALTLRLSILLGTLPLLDQRNLPLIWRLALAVVVAAALAPQLAPQLPPAAELLAWPRLVTEAVQSLLVGALLAFAVNLVFAVVRFAGTVADMQIGFGIVNTYDPYTSSQISIIAQTYYLLSVLLFFAVDAHHMVMRTVVQSCVVLPPFMPAQIDAGALLIVREYGQVFTLGLRLAAPVVVVLLLVSSAMGVIVKTAPQIHVMVVGFPIQIAVGLFTLGASLVIFKDFVIGLFAANGGLLERLLLALV
jgi:flagellar biosynthetic protein FliR